MSWEEELDKEMPRVKRGRISLAVPLGAEITPSPIPSASLPPALPSEPVTLETALSVFQTAKSPDEIFAYAKDCSTPVWLDWLVKLSPKNVKVQGQMDVRAVFANLGPARRS